MRNGQPMAMQAGPYSAVPAKVEAAQSYLHYAAMLRLNSGNGPALSGDMPRDERELSRKEQVVYDSALDVLRMYFQGEMEFESPPPMPQDFGEEDPPAERVEATP